MKLRNLTSRMAGFPRVGDALSEVDGFNLDRVHRVRSIVHVTPAAAVLATVPCAREGDPRADASLWHVALLPDGALDVVGGVWTASQASIAARVDELLRDQSERARVARDMAVLL